MWSETYGASPTSQLSWGAAGMWKIEPGPSSIVSPPFIAAVARPDTTMPTCSTSQSSVPAMGPT